MGAAQILFQGYQPEEIWVEKIKAEFMKETVKCLDLQDRRIIFKITLIFAINILSNI
jgi:hypothetical protein